MKRINMSKYGFVRWPEEDFIDDGSRFTCYRAGKRVRVTKCLLDGEVFISARIDGNKLPYGVYCKLPHYQSLDALNGVAVNTLTDDMLVTLFKECLLYEQEYDKAESTIVMPTMSDIKAQCMKVQAKIKQQLADLNNVFKLELALELPSWEWEDVRKSVVQLYEKLRIYDPETYPKKIFGTARSIVFCNDNCAELQDSYFYTRLLKYINK